jgi:hypothetical protein
MNIFMQKIKNFFNKIVNKIVDFLAPEGYEDKNGFHYGKNPDDH